jgi:hypothetical protein
LFISARARTVAAVIFGGVPGLDAVFVIHHGEDQIARTCHMVGPA